MSGFLSLLNANYLIDDNYGYQLSAVAYLILNKKMKLSADVFNIETKATQVLEFASKVESKKYDRVAIVSVQGPMFRDDHFCGPKGMLSLANELKDLDNDPSIDAIVFDVFTPGGQAIGVEELADTVSSLSKPNVTCAELIASGGMYAFAGSDHIMLRGKNARAGSIGAAKSYVDFSKKLEKEGIEEVRLVADTSPEKNKNYRIDDSTKAKRGIIEEELNPLDQHFMDHIKTHLPNVSQKALDGKVFYAEAAIKNGIAHSIGSLDDAIQMALDLVNKTTSNQKSNSLNMNLDTPITTQEAGDPSVEGTVAEETQLPTEEITALQSQVEALSTQVSALKKMKETFQTTIKAQSDTIKNLNAQIESLEKLPASGDGAIVASAGDVSNQVKDLDPVDAITAEVHAMIRQGREAAGLRD